MRQHHTIVEAKHPVTDALQTFRAVVVVPSLTFIMMLAAVCFDDEASLVAEEVDVVGADLMLAAKF